MVRLEFRVDEFGSEILEVAGEEGEVKNRPCAYKGHNAIVMMEWEKPYMRALVDELAIMEETDVLEIGFGCGYSAERIQELRPRSHAIVECAPAVLERLRPWAQDRPGVAVVEGFWQTALPPLGTFDAVFFDDFPLPGTPESEDLAGPASRWHAFIELCVAHHLKPGGRITGYLARPLDLRWPGCHMAEPKPFPVSVPPNCPYFPYQEAYIPLVTLNRGVSDESRRASERHGACTCATSYAPGTGTRTGRGSSAGRTSTSSGGSGRGDESAPCKACAATWAGAGAAAPAQARGTPAPRHAPMVIGHCPPGRTEARKKRKREALQALVCHSMGLTAAASGPDQG